MNRFGIQDRRRLPQHSIFKESIEAFGQELANFFPDRDIVPSFSVKQDEDLKDVREQYNQKTLAYPCLLICWIPYRLILRKPTVAFSIEMAWLLIKCYLIQMSV